MSSIEKKQMIVKCPKHSVVTVIQSKWPRAKVYVCYGFAISPLMLFHWWNKKRCKTIIQLFFTIFQSYPPSCFTLPLVTVKQLPEIRGSLQKETSLLAKSQLKYNSCGLLFSCKEYSHGVLQVNCSSAMKLLHGTILWTL